MGNLSKSLTRRVRDIAASGATIYDVPTPRSALWFTSSELEDVLQAALVGMSLNGLPLRTRSKVIKTAVCEALGYPVPTSFRKTQPRFPAQDFDTYVQKSNNLQIWNEEISPSRRYVLIRIDDDDEVTRVRVVGGEVIAKFDTTGTLTHKFQARLVVGATPLELVTPNDTQALRAACRYSSSASLTDPTSSPTPEYLMPIALVFDHLKALCGQRFRDAGSDQERNRGADLHAVVSRALGYPVHADNGQFPDLPEQLLEVKLQTSPTIDLGLVSPDSDELVDVPAVGGVAVRHCDVRYAVFRAEIANGNVTLTGLVVCTGESFFGRFTKFQGKVINRKLQIPLPSGFFEA